MVCRGKSLTLMYHGQLSSKISVYRGIREVCAELPVSKLAKVIPFSFSSTKRWFLYLERSLTVV